MYDVRFETDAGGLVLASLLSAVQRGVAVRLLYNVAHPGPIPVPPPPETGPEAIESLPIDTRGVAGIPDLMHHKYVVRDGDAVWTGSTNWTDDSWTRQENVIVTVRSPKIAYAYSLTFDQLWETGQVANTGSDPRPQQVNGAQVRAWFCPEHGEALSHRVAKHIGKARERVRIASPVLTSGPILATLVEVVNEQPLRRSRHRRRHAGRRGLPPVAHERGQRMEGSAPAARPRGRSVQRQGLDPVDARIAARLHAREGRRRRRHDLRRQLQLLALGRAERGERARDRRRGDRGSAGAPTWTSSARATRGRRSRASPLPYP